MDADFSKDHTQRKRQTGMTLTIRGFFIRPDPGTYHHLPIHLSPFIRCTQNIGTELSNRIAHVLRISKLQQLAAEHRAALLHPFGDVLNHISGGIIHVRSLVSAGRSPLRFFSAIAVGNA